MVNRRNVPLNLALPIAAKKLLNLGADLANKGMVNESIVIFEQLILLGDKNSAVYTNLGQAYFETGLLEKAEKYCRKAIRSAPNLVAAYEFLGRIYNEKGDFTNAIKYYEKALKLKPNDYVTLANIGKAFLDKGMAENARDFLERSKKEKVTAFACNVLGFVYANLDNFEKSVEEFKEATQIEPDNWIYHADLGGAFLEDGLWTEAIEEYQKWVELTPKSAAAHNALGAAYANANDFDSAKKEFYKAVQLDPSLEIAKKNLINVSNSIAMEDADGNNIDHKLPLTDFSLVSNEGYWEITDFEEEFRISINTKMENLFGPHWWKRRVPSEIYNRWLNKKQDKEEKALAEIEILDPIFYADFSDYAVIIERRDNWEELFHKYFINKQVIQTKLSELCEIRNDIMHRGRHVLPQDLAKMKLYIKEILFGLKRKVID